MSSDPSALGRQHAAAPSLSQQPPEPSHAVRARTLFALCSTGALSTLSRKHAGFPFGSLMPYALDDAGRPIFLISNMAMHTQNLKSDPRASLFVGEPTPAADALGAARATLLGRAEPVSLLDAAPARESYLARHPNSSYWVDFTDFSFFRLEPVELYYVGGFGVMGWVSANDYGGAVPDPLAPVAASMVAHMNADHADAMLLLVHTYAQITATHVSMTAVDRLGFMTRLETAEGVKSARINFPREVATAQQAREILIEMIELARKSR